MPAVTVAVRCAAGGRRQAAGGRRQAAGGRRHAAGGMLGGELNVGLQDNK